MAPRQATSCAPASWHRSSIGCRTCGSSCCRHCRRIPPLSGSSRTLGSRSICCPLTRRTGSRGGCSASFSPVSSASARPTRFASGPRRNFRTRGDGAGSELLSRAVAPDGPNGDWYGGADRLLRDPQWNRCSNAIALARGDRVAGIDLRGNPGAAGRASRRRALDRRRLELGQPHEQILPPRRVDRLVLWNASMREEAQTLHRYETDRIAVAASRSSIPTFATRARAAMNSAAGPASTLPGAS